MSAKSPVAVYNAAIGKETLAGVSGSNVVWGYNVVWGASSNDASESDSLAIRGEP